MEVDWDELYEEDDGENANAWNGPCLLVGNGIEEDAKNCIFGTDDCPFPGRECSDPWS